MVSSVDIITGSKPSSDAAASSARAVGAPSGAANTAVTAAPRPPASTPRRESRASTTS